MSDKSAKTLSHLLRRWLRGETDASGEQELDRLAGKDAFLADAMEGFRTFPEGRHEASLARIRSKVDARTRRGGAFPFALGRWAAVATFLLLAGVMLWQLAPERQEIAVAAPEEPPAAAAGEELTTAPEARRETSAEPAPVEPLPPAKRSGPKPEAPAPIAQAEPDGREEEPYTPLFYEDSEAISAPEQAPSPAPEVFDAKPSENNRSAPAARSAPAERVPRPKASFLDSGAVYSGEEKKIAEKREAEETLRKARSRPAEEAADAVSREPMPEGGWEVFNAYLKKNLRYPAPARKKGIKGEVRLQFQVEADGSLSNFKILKSLGYGCDEEAIRVLRKGPAWERPEGGAPTSASLSVFFGS